MRLSQYHLNPPGAYRMHEYDGVNLTPHLGFASFQDVKPSHQFWPVTRPSVLSLIWVPEKVVMR